MKNQRLMASAGTGKTYALTNRYIRILLQQREPEKILAMTFTRKAAGEFFHKVLIKLLEAAENPQRAVTLAAELGFNASQEDFTKLLRLMVESLPRLQLNTFDSFFASLIRCFPMELGLPGAPEILPPEEVLTTQRRILSNTLDQKTLADEDLQNLAQIIAEMTAGRERNSTLNLLLELIEDSLPVFFQCPDPTRWGNPLQIWGAQRFQGPFSLQNLHFPETSWQQLLQQTEILNFSDKRVSPGLITVLVELRKFYFTGKLEKETSLLKLFLSDPEALTDSSFEFSYYNKSHALPNAYREALYQIIMTSLHSAFLHLCRRTQAYAKFLHVYLNHYEEESFRSGRFSFADTARLLDPSRLNPLTGISPNHELMQYRLDTRFDHWLLDEFQDTSRSQWNTIEPLVDEILQDPEKRRTFFYVGDVKQCLYQWRGSDASLFEEIFQAYRPEIEEGEALHVSWRSRPEILDTVNRVFGDPGLIRDQINESIASLWTHFWSLHQPAQPLRTPGKACASLEGYEKGNREDLYQKIVKLLQTAQPLERGLSVGILTRDNHSAREIADYLRSHTPLPVTVEADRSPFTDNPCGLLLLQWITAALHPSDTTASGMIKLYQPDLDTQEIRQWTEQIHFSLFSEGIQYTLSLLIPLIRNSLIQHFPAHHPFPELLQLRLEQCREAGRLYDERKLADPEPFLEFATHYRITDSGSNQSIQILTIHKSKGLDYDIVIVDTPDKAFLREPNQPLLVRKNRQHEVEWVLEKPAGKISDIDPILSSARMELQQQNAFGELCVLYVAMTRARSGLYLFAPQNPSPKSGKPASNTLSSPITLLTAALSQEDDPTDLQENPQDNPLSPKDSPLYLHGTPNWFEQYPIQKISTAPPPARAPDRPFPLPVRLTRLRASLDEESEKKGSWYLSTANAETREQGTEVHAFFERIEWLSGTPDSWEEQLRPHQQSLSETLFQHLLSLLRLPAWQPFFRQPSPEEEVQVWREKAFSVVLNGKWMNGVFDRVLLRYQQGTLHSVDLLDFKTDRIQDSQEEQKKTAQHRPQLQAYHQALEILFGKVEIQTRLAFTVNGALQEIERPV